MRRNARYTTLGDEDTGYNNSHELTFLNERTINDPRPFDKTSEYDQAGGNRLQRFYGRAVVGLLGPIVICVYYFAIWRLYLTSNGSTEPMLFGHRGAAWIFYGWFIAGVLGLALSLYSLSGVEASMLMEPAWNVGDATQLMLHANKSWSGPGGWMRTIKWAGDSPDGQYRWPSSLWFLLALSSVLVFIAFPLSGLTMEITRGYRRAPVLVPATLSGNSYETFNEREAYSIFERSQLNWKSGQDMKLPGAGIVYTPENFVRSRSAFLKQMPASLPTDDGVPTIFLTAQADQPIEGRSWGLLLEYNCRIIKQASDFQILKVIRAPRFNYTPPSDDLYGGSLARGKVFLGRKNQTDQIQSATMDAVLVTAAELWPEFDVEASRATANVTNQCYYKKDKNSTTDYPGIHPRRHEIFEIALWQRLQDNSTFLKSLDVPLKYNVSIDHNITEFFGKYDTRAFRGLSKAEYALSPPLPMTAIGVQCNASSNVGSADIDGVRSSYSNFRRTDTPDPKGWDRCAPRFGARNPEGILYNGNWAGRWLNTLLEASGAPTPYYDTYNQFENGTKSVYSYQAHLGFLQAEELRRGMLRAYASYAMQLMYNGGQAYTTQNGSRLTFINPDATAFEPGPVIKPGVMPAIIPVILFCAWALISSTLGILYGFRRRWTETLDGHAMFRLGAELSDEDRRALRKTSNIIKTEDRVALDDIPALVGDTKAEMRPGRIGLVRVDKADKKKLYE